MTAPRVKICGLTTPGCVRAVNRAGVDWVGFNFWRPSKRFVAPERAGELALGLNPGVVRVGVFVDPSVDEVRAAIGALRLDWLQFHGDESPDFCRRFQVPGIKAFRLRDRSSLAQIGAYLEAAETLFLVDTFVAGEPGGSGRRLALELARAAADLGGRMILAGGLRAENVAAAVAAVRPFAVDVASGVESSPGVKDPERVLAFVEATRCARR